MASAFQEIVRQDTYSTNNTNNDILNTEGRTVATPIRAGEPVGVEMGIGAVRVVFGNDIFNRLSLNPLVA